MRLRNRILTSAIFVMLLNVVTANTVNVFKVIPIDKESFALHIGSSELANLEVSIIDENGLTMHEVELKETSNYERIYNIKEIPAATYTVVVKYNSMVILQPIVKSFSGLTVKEEALETLYRPSLIQDAENLKFKVYASGTLKTRLSIIDSEGNAAYSQTFDAEGVLRKNFNLEKLEAGSYTFQLELVEGNVDYTFNETFEILNETMAAL